MTPVITILGFVAVLLLAAGTPRQAATLWGATPRDRRPHRLRAAGLLLLCTDAALIACGGDPARTLTAWIGQLGLDALAAALLCAALPKRPPPPRKGAPP
ncbi:conserved hypothetical protein [Gluconacetobacter diazotrophicus PA1 5]|nr:DUF3325 family protein [Gluconacetobacter diazotrophicus]ACI52331.1 conserved hypothetical protein [Gluconacetobacter diazotrophicus PA1 5]TWB05573.1 uncharacterized protein DUF3325 [Gluconacetobacter diazotrophicus]